MKIYYKAVTGAVNTAQNSKMLWKKHEHIHLKTIFQTAHGLVI